MFSPRRANATGFFVTLLRMSCSSRVEGGGAVDKLLHLATSFRTAIERTLVAGNPLPTLEGFSIGSCGETSRKLLAGKYI
jgi:hypothetical protein